MANLSFQLAADSHQGMRRTGNEDSYAVVELPGCEAAFIVCDGMGGLRAGDIASKESVRVIEDVLQRRFAIGNVEPLRALQEAFQRANDAVNALARPTSEEPTVDPQAGAAPTEALMGSTAVVGIARGGTLFLAHAGDSRAYRLREGRLERLTADHSFVEEQVRLGTMTEAEARISKFRNMVTRAIGIEPTVTPEFHQDALLPGDLILACSDGLTTMLEDEEIATVLAAGGTRAQQVASLIQAANARGGLDNITVVLLAVEGIGAPPTRSAVPLQTTPSRRNKTAPATKPQRRRSGSIPPLVGVLAMLGALTLLGMLALGISERLRSNLAARLVKPTPAPVVRQALDFSGLIYERPRVVMDRFLARHDQLALLPGPEYLFVTNSQGQLIHWMPRDGRATVAAANLPVPDQIKAPDEVKDEFHIATDPQGNFYLSLSARGVIKKLSTSGAELTRVEQLNHPGALAVDPESGDIYFVDGANSINILRAKARPQAPAPKR